MLAVAQTPPRSRNAGTSLRYVGSVAISNPPYPYSIVGFVPSFLRSLRWVTKIGTRVPSVDVAKTRSVVKPDGSNVSLGGSNGVLLPVARSKRKTVLGARGDVNE